MTFKKRVRINVATSVKGIKTYDVTVELEGEEEDGEIKLDWVALAASDELVAELDQRYPPGGIEG